MSIVEDACRLHVLPEQVCADVYRKNPDVSRLADQIALKIPILTENKNLLARLARPVALALNYAHQLVELLGHPRRLDRHLWSRDPYIPILFDSFDAGSKLLAQSKHIRNIFEHSSTQDGFFLMTMHRHEYEIMGSELEGEIIKRDVRQTVISFEDHSVALAAATEQLAATAIMDAIVLYLADLVPKRLHQAELLRSELEQSEKLLKAQIHTLEQARQQHKAYDVPPEIQIKLQDGLQEASLMSDKLKTLPGNPTPPEYLGLIRNVLLHPHKHLSIDDVKVYTQEYGIKVPKEKGREIRFLEFRAWGVQPLAVLFAVINRETARQLWPDLDHGEYIRP